MKRDPPFRDHPLDIAARGNACPGQQLGDALRAFVAGRPRLGPARFVRWPAVTARGPRNGAAFGSLLVCRFFHGVWMLFGKHKRIVNRILIVEDEPLTAFDSENLITDAGYEVVATIDRFGEAVEILDREPVDLILCDVRLTGERTGIDLAREARRRRIPVLFVTGDPPGNAAELAIGCLLKPYNDRTLKAALAAIDKYLAGEKVSPPRGLTLYPAAKV